MAGFAVLAAAGLLLRAAVAAEPGADTRPAGLVLTSADGMWQLRLRGLLQLDGRLFTSDAAGRPMNEWLVRRARPILEGRLGRRTAFRITPNVDSGGARIIGAYVETRLARGLALRAGEFKPSVGLEGSQPSSELVLVERSIVNELLPQRDLGLRLTGGRRRFSWALTAFDGIHDGRGGQGPEDGNAELALRLLARPLEGRAGGTLGLGLGLTRASLSGSATVPLLPAYRSPGHVTLFDYRSGSAGSFAAGRRVQVVPQLYWFKGPAGVMAEWVRVREDVHAVVANLSRGAALSHDAWEITGEWFVTGEPAGLAGPAGGRGAVQIAARLSTFAADDRAFAGAAASFADPAVAVSRARTEAVGVNWFPLPWLRGSAAYQRTRFRGGAASGANRPGERLLMLQCQLSF